MAAKGHVPSRRCVVCRQSAPKHQLIRVARSPDKWQLELDLSGRGTGRGAYLCRSMVCLVQGLKKGAIQRALKTSPGREQMEALGEAIEREIKRWQK